MRATDNLRYYLSEAVLPPVQVLDEPATRYDSEGEQQRPGLTVIPANWRQLHVMRRLNPNQLNDKIRAVQAKYPSEPLEQTDFDPESGERICIPSNSDFDIPPISFNGGPGAAVVEEVVLQTATRALHLAYPSSSEWCFLELGDCRTDRNKIRVHGLTRPCTSSKDKERCSMLVFVLAKWVFTKRHMHEFSALTTIPSEVDMANLRPNSPVTFAEELWMKLWDVCVNRGAHHWAVTTYDEWIFGGFSDGWSTGSVSAIRSRDAASPTTVLQQFLAWMGASLSLSKEIVIRSVPEAAHNAHMIAESSKWESPDELVRDDTWSCPDDASQLLYEDPKNPNPLYPTPPGSAIARSAAAERQAEADSYDAIPEMDRISVYSLETAPFAAEPRPVESSRQAQRYGQNQQHRFKEWLTKPKFMTGYVHCPEEPHFPEITEVEAEMMWEEEKQYFNFNPFTREQIARLPHLPVETVPDFDNNEREDRLKIWVSASNSKADPNNRLPEHEISEDPFSDDEQAAPKPSGLRQPFELSLNFVQAQDKKPIVLAAATEVGSCGLSVHSKWSSTANAIQQPFGELLGHIDNGADSVRDMIVES